MLARGILGSGRTRGVSFRPFPNSSGWGWLISSIFLIRISCHKTTHANGYYGTWPGWAVSISVLPLTNTHTYMYTRWIKLVFVEQNSIIIASVSCRFYKALARICKHTCYSIFYLSILFLWDWFVLLAFALSCIFIHNYIFKIIVRKKKNLLV